MAVSPFKLTPVISAISLALSSTHLLAKEQITELPRIDINSGKVAYDQPGSYEFIEKEKIELQQPLSTGDALRKVAGVNIKAEEETSVVANIGLRGLSSAEQKTLILEDGVPVAPGLFIGNGRYYNPRIQHIESIEILKGAASLKYGPSTIGGVINYRSKTPEEGVSLSGRVGSHSLREATLEAGAVSTSGDAQLGIVYTKAQSDGFQDKDYVMQDIVIKGGMEVSDNQWFGIKFSQYDNDANISYRGLFKEDYQDRKSYNPAPDDYLLTERKSLDLNHEWDINNDLSLSTVVYWSEVSRDYWRYDVDTNASEVAGRWVYTNNLTGNNRSFERIGLDSRLKYRHDLFDMENELETGFRVFKEESDDTRIRATRAQDRTGINDRHRQDEAESVAFFVQNSMDLTDALTVTPGLRMESYKQTRTVLTDNNSTESTSNTEWLPGIGLTYDFSDQSQLFASAYKAFSPATNAAALDGLTDQKLDAERSNNLELGVRGETSGLNYEFTAFQMDFSNQVVDGNSNPNLSKQNGGETLHRGLEAQLGYALSSAWRVDANVTYIPVSEFTNGANKGNRISYSPEVIANLEVSYHQGPLKAALAVNHSGLQFADSANTKKLPEGAAGGVWGGELEAYTVLDLYANYQLNKKLNVFGSIKNLTDERYIAGLRQGIYAGPERSFEVGAKYKF